MNDPKPTRPVIGITMDIVDGKPAYHLAFAYAEAIERAGGLPFAIPYRVDPALIPQYLDLCNGILFTGGNDLDPATYGEDWHPKAIPIQPERQSFEMALIAEVERRRLPALCICLGCQLLNVYRGGTLNQFLPDLEGKGEHRKVGETLIRHPVKMEGESALAKAIGKTEFSANTYHKQSVKTPGKGLRVIATAPDGVIEGLEDPTFPMLIAVQWHPERLIDEPEHLAPFKLLVQKARGE